VLGEKPREIAQKLAGRLQDDADIKSVEVAGPGFLNFRLNNQVWQRVLLAVLTKGEGFGRSDIGAGKKVNVEFVSANPTGPMHVGHTRGAIFGDALASLLEFCGYAVSREYYVNDAGAQVDVLARSAFLRYRQALGQQIGEIPAGLYPGQYLVPLGEALAQEFGERFIDEPEAVWLAPVKKRVLKVMLEMIRDDLKLLGVSHDVFFCETSLHGENGKIAQTLDWLRHRGLIYQGRLPPPKGKTPEDWQEREQTLFRASDFGDDTDRALIKSDGSYTYFAADIAYHRDKYLRGFNDQIIVLGADHSGYCKRLTAALKAVSQGQATIDVKICQIVRLMRDGKAVKMSKRSGDLITVADLVKEVGTDAARFMLLFRRKQRRDDGFRFRQGKGTNPRQPGVLRPVRPRASLFGGPHGRQRSARS